MAKNHEVFGIQSKENTASSSEILLFTRFIQIRIKNLTTTTMVLQAQVNVYPPSRLYIKITMIIAFNPLRLDLTEWSNTLKQFSCSS